MDLTKALSDFAESLKFENLPIATVENTKLFIADYIASCYAGYKVNKSFNKAVLSLIEASINEGEVSYLKSKRNLPVEYAAYMNAIYAHGADMDDGNRKAMGHIAAHVMSTVFAVGQTVDVSWKDIIVAINIGYEVYNRVAAAVQPGLVHRGFHSTGTAGAIACAAASAKLYGLDSKGIYNSMAIASIQASGLIIIAESGQSCKPLNPANAARTGIQSSILTMLGVKGPINPLQSKKGWIWCFSNCHCNCCTCFFYYFFKKK